MNFKAMFDDQHNFNQQIWKPIAEYDNGPASEHYMNRLRHLSLGFVEEALEFLRTYEWKSHRKRQGKLQNVAHSHEELIDMFKYWLSMADLAEFPIDELETLYYAKSRVVQYRYQEEWINDITGPCVIVDIDNVLADYISGICTWARQWGPSILGMSNSATATFIHKLAALQGRYVWVNAESVGVTPQQWARVKHEFRTRGAKRSLPIFSDARPFLEWCRARGWLILLITSRPVDQYPNLFSDTLAWLDEFKLPFDHLWWATHKGERLDECPATMRGLIQFAVDDDQRFVAQYRSRGIRSYWLNRGLLQVVGDDDPTTVRSLDEIIIAESVSITV